MNVTNTTWEAITARGALIRTFDNRPAALAWKRSEDALRFPGSSVEEVTSTVTTTRRRVGHLILARMA